MILRKKSMTNINPTYLIILGLVILALVNSGATKNFFGSTINLEDPTTNTTYTCDTLIDCYNQTFSQITSGLTPALSCVANKCVLAECIEGNKESKTCWDGKTIVLRECVEGSWSKYTTAECARTPCTNNNECVKSVDTDCDGELEAQTGTCSNNKCSYDATKACTKNQITFNQYKIYIISIALMLLGIGGTYFALRKKR